MGYELWISPNTGIRRKGTTFKELQSLFIDKISTKYIYEPIYSCKLTDESLHVKETLKKKLLDNKDQAIFSKKLATIRCDVPIKFDLEDCRVETYSHQKVVKLFQELDFKSLINRLPSRQLVI